ncbi:DUF2750 domain-containing protein [Marinobacter fuscus]|uniref:DUF2750 domain-containing protein n=1 Tax=Marinobacter fuscus TaxID=2109942 RepID=A0A2T1KHR8_9GAMM|nr:DUF2750 domain-containing protein [Marinobacter fuscus]PSF09706.1 DUF2750 domain-containing protein [Marinobacter fuscus]
MSNSPLEPFLEMDGEERYDYFLDAVAEERDIWILINPEQQFLKIVSDEDGLAYLPVWPTEALAEAYADGDAGLSAKAVSLPDFFKKWVPGLSRDGIEVGVFPCPQSDLWITSPEELKSDLQEAMAGPGFF